VQDTSCRGDWGCPPV